MKTPVIVPSYNEENNIGRLLNALPKDLVEPIVASNGSSDKTVQIAESYGAKVYDIREQGKLPAIQHALRGLGERALDPLFIIDADTVPILPRRWHKRMMTHLDPRERQPIMLAGPIWFTPNPDVPYTATTSIARSIFRLGLSVATKNSAERTGEGGGQYGPNRGLLIFKHTTLKRLLDLPHLWPREDVAEAKAIVNDGEGVFKQVLDIETLAITPESDVYEPLSSWFKHGVSAKAIEQGIKETDAKVRAKYMRRAAPGSEPYDD